MAPRYVTLRHSTSSGRWCVEAPHPAAGIPQPYCIEGARLFYPTLRAAKDGLASCGLLVIKNKKTGVHHVYRAGAPLIA